MPDVIVVGDGPGGLSAALFLARRQKDVVVIGQDQTAMHFAQLNNYLGVSSVHGSEFQRHAREQVQAAGATLHDDQVTEIEAYEKEKEVKSFVAPGQPLMTADVEAATRDANFRYTPAVLLKDANEQLKLADRDALRFLMMVGEKRSQQWIFGQTLTLLRPDVVLAFQLEAPASRYDRAIELFTRLTDRVQIANDHALALRHRELLKAGDAWLKQLNPDLIQSLAHGESWHRITRDGEDVGYLRFAVRAGEQLGVTGVQMKEQIHRISEPLILDSFNEFFESDDNNAEFWSYKVTHRPMSPLTDSVVKLPAPQPAPQSAQTAPPPVQPPRTSRDDVSPRRPDFETLLTRDDPRSTTAHDALSELLARSASRGRSSAAPTRRRHA